MNKHILNYCKKYKPPFDSVLVLQRKFKINYQAAKEAMEEYISWREQMKKKETC